MVPGLVKMTRAAGLASKGSARHLGRDSGAGHYLYTRLFSKCHAPPLGKLLTNTISKSLNTYINVMRAAQLKMSFFAPEQLRGGQTVNCSQTRSKLYLPIKQA